MAFNIWRDNASVLTKRKFYLERMTKKILPFYQIRLGFNQLRNKAHFLKRLEAASHLLVQFQQTKELARAMRKWRLQLLNR